MKTDPLPQKPLIVGFVGDRELQQAIGAMQVQWFPVQSPQQLALEQTPRAPRLFLIQATRETVGKIAEIIVSLRRQRPLTDVLVWFPKAGGEAVRKFFHAGAKDVIVSRSAGTLVAAVDQILDDQKFLPRIEALTRQRSRTARFESMLSRSQAMWDLFDLCTRIAPADATVLIEGETGTGKELLARAVHRRSGRSGRFVAANCASIPPELINSELFGHAKGAFTGADRAKTGLVSHADGGTLFLDEIGDMPAEGQLSLLRMLQEKRVRPVGSLVETDVNVRVVAATNVALAKAVREEKFREDLFYRLDVIRMNLPALRERPEDILFLFGHFTKKLAKHYGLDPPNWSDGFLDALVQYDWPGNVRQLENFSERLILARPQSALTAHDFQRLRSSEPGAAKQSSADQRFARRSSEVDASRTLQANVDEQVRRLEQAYLEQVLQRHAGRIADAAQQAGISRRTLLRKMNRYRIDKKQFKA